MKIELLDEVVSTNDCIKRYLGEGEDVIVCARRQTGGKGTKGRAFLSEEGGVYLSALTFYEGLPAAQAFTVMAHAAVAVCKTAERFGVRARIKWPNDVLADGKKLCGILIENVLAGDTVKASIVGIGINVCNNVSALGGIAVSLSSLAAGATVEAVRDALIGEYGTESDFSDYLRYLDCTGRTVRVMENGREYAAYARRVLPDGRLEIEADGAVRALSGAEISLKL